MPAVGIGLDERRQAERELQRPHQRDQPSALTSVASVEHRAANMATLE